jgi:D-3-phosphoglycerate dehydrogenase
MLQNYYGEKAVEGLRTLGELKFNSLDHPLSTPELIGEAQGCQIIVSDRQTPGEAAAFHALPDLVAFMRCAVDIRTIDVAAASAAGVLVTRASPGFVAAVAELAIGFMIDLGRNVSRSACEFRAGRQPQARMGRQLDGSTLGIIGYGAIGRHLADLGVALGMRVMASDPYVKIVRDGVRQLPLGDLLAEADFVVCLAVATEETENLIDAKALARMKRTAYFINLSRGNLVDEAALSIALDAGLIAGAAMDVGRAQDQMPSPLLAARHDVVATPHLGGLTPSSIEHQAMETVAQAAEIVAGRAPKGSVNAEHARRLSRLANR